MPAYYEIKWLPSGKTQSFPGLRGVYYELSAGNHIDLESFPVWCHDCSKITHGEDISTVEAIEKQIAEAHVPSSAVYQILRHGAFAEFSGPGEESLVQYVTKLRQRKSWREKRLSPAKCLKCGSTKIVIFENRVPTSNPMGTGQIEVDCVGMCSTNFINWYFTPEGDRIARDTRPSHWHHPELDKPKERKRFMDWIRARIGGDRSAR